jgi:outer membrane protein OmpA-like peptidoglycan-associated protein
VDIRAYTDSSGNIARNLALSQKRVFELRNYLILHDIPEEKITTDAGDATNFLESNSTDRLGSPNHRVELTIR